MTDTVLGPHVRQPDLRPPLGRPRQLARHDHLTRATLWHPPSAAASTTRLDAIIVPATRHAHRLRPVIRLAALGETPLVVMASHRCDVEQVARLVADQPGAKALIISVPEKPPTADLTLATSAPWVRDLSGGRASNLSLKRNVGLMLARLRGWRKIMFIDDDILPLSPEVVRRVAYHLEHNLFAGLKTVAMADNSVVCHANRLSGGEQGIFVSGAALGVNTADLPLEVFPDVYNEDWFALLHEAATNKVAYAGDARQLEFNPFKNPLRAGHEEFGDLVAEGLFAALAHRLPAERTTETYWERFIADRRRLIEEIDERLEPRQTHESVQAQAALARAWAQLELITPTHCLGLIECWRQDRIAFRKATARLQSNTPLPDALAQLGLTSWRQAQFADADTTRPRDLLVTLGSSAPRRTYTGGRAGDSMGRTGSRNRSSSTPIPATT